MTDKQKAMFVLYGLVIKDGLTKGQASKLIETAKQSGLRPTDENQKQADKLFETIGRQEAKDKLKELSKQVADGIKAIQNKKATIEEMEELKERLEEVFQELSGIIDNRIDEIDQAECDKANEEDD